MNRKQIILITFLSIFILLVIPNINAIEIYEIENENKTKIQEKINTIKLSKLNILNSQLLNPFIKKLLLIIYIIGYIAFIPIGITIHGHLDSDGHLDFKELMQILLECLLWPYIFLDIIKALLEDVNYCNISN